MKILITGSAGFIGYHLTELLLKEANLVVGIDNINDYYDVNLKYGRLNETGIAKESIEYNVPVASSRYDNYIFYKLNLEDEANINALFKEYSFDVVINLAAQAGVRYSLENPQAYISSNIVGFLNILESSRKFSVKHLIYASSSSVYGLNESAVFSTKDATDHQVSIYAASKRSNELMAHVYSHLYGLPTTGLRFFTVYGPWGRPDMALFLFTKAILENKPISVFNNGDMYRDFTYIKDIVEGIKRMVNSNAPKGLEKNVALNPANSFAPYKVYNIGNNAPVKLVDFIDVLEQKLGKQASKIYLPLQPGDVFSTHADVHDLIEDFGYEPNTSISHGIEQFVNWYKHYYTT